MKTNIRPSLSFTVHRMEKVADLNNGEVTSQPILPKQNVQIDNKVPLHTQPEVEEVEETKLAKGVKFKLAGSNERMHIHLLGDRSDEN